MCFALNWQNSHRLWDKFIIRGLKRNFIIWWGSVFLFLSLSKIKQGTAERSLLWISHARAMLAYSRRGLRAFTVPSVTATLILVLSSPPLRHKQIRAKCPDSFLACRGIIITTFIPLLLYSYWTDQRTVPWSFSCPSFYPFACDQIVKPCIKSASLSGTIKAAL